MVVAHRVLFLPVADTKGSMNPFVLKTPCRLLMTIFRFLCGIVGVCVVFVCVCVCVRAFLWRPDGEPGDAELESERLLSRQNYRGSMRKRNRGETDARHTEEVAGSNNIARLPSSRVVAANETTSHPSLPAVAPSMSSSLPPLFSDAFLRLLLHEFDPCLEYSDDAIDAIQLRLGDFVDRAMAGAIELAAVEVDCLVSQKPVVPADLRSTTPEASEDAVVVCVTSAHVADSIRMLYGIDATSEALPRARTGTV